MSGALYAVGTALAWALTFVAMGYFWYGRTLGEVIYAFIGVFMYSLLGMGVGRWWKR